MAGDQMLSLSGQGVAPGQATADFYKSRGMDRIPTGPGDKAHFSFTVPGIVEAFISLLERFGSMPIQIAGGLIPQQQTRPSHQRPCHGNPLLLPSR